MIFLLGARGGHDFRDLTFGLSDFRPSSSVFFPVFSGSAFTGSRGHSGGRAKLSARQPLSDASLRPIEMMLPRHRHTFSESLDVGRWGWEPPFSPWILPCTLLVFLFSFLFPSPPFLKFPKGAHCGGCGRPGLARARRGAQEDGRARGWAPGRHRSAESGGGQRQARAAHGCTGAADLAGPLGGGISGPGSADLGVEAARPGARSPPSRGHRRL